MCIRDSSQADLHKIHGAAVGDKIQLIPLKYSCVGVDALLYLSLIHICPSTFTYRFKLILKANNLPLDLNVHSLRPVSYTHLDVYKRQDKNTA